MAYFIYGLAFAHRLYASASACTDPACQVSDDPTNRYPSGAVSVSHIHPDPNDHFNAVATRAQPNTDAQAIFDANSLRCSEGTL